MISNHLLSCHAMRVQSLDMHQRMMTGSPPYQSQPASLANQRDLSSLAPSQGQARTKEITLKKVTLVKLIQPHLEDILG